MKEMAILFLLLLTFGEYFLHSQCVNQPLKVYVDGARGHNSQRCLDSNSSQDNPCESLSFVALNLTQKELVDIEIVGEWLNLTQPANFSSFSNINISGCPINNTTISGCLINSTTIECTEFDAGLSFVNVMDLSVTSVTILNCGLMTSTSSGADELLVAVFVLKCTNVYLGNVVVDSSSGTGLSLYDTNGTVTIDHCNFTNNGIMNESDISGGGMHIEFTCRPGTERHYISHNGRNTDSNYIIRNCLFTKNIANSSCLNCAFISPFSNKSISLKGIGGGLYLCIGANATGNNFTIEHCIFDKNQANYFGGGMDVAFLNSATDNTVIVYKTMFVRNKCLHSNFSGGGGLVIASLHYNSYFNDSHILNNKFVCDLCSFENNTADIMGGGTAIYASRETNREMLTTITFSKSSWTNNMSPMGAAVFVSIGIWDYTNEGYLSTVKFTNCTFESNTPMKNKPSNGMNVESVGYGAVFISELKGIFEGQSTFCNNVASAVHLTNSVMEFSAQSNVTFCNNTSNNGGAIAMYGASMIRIKEDSLLLWINNTAYSKGGAIYIDFHGATHPAYHNCFISPQNFSHVNSRLIFKNNSAGANGSSVFATTLKPCVLFCSDYEVDNLEDIMQCIADFTFEDSGGGSSPLSTLPEKFELFGPPPPLVLIPGVEYSLPLSASDEAHTNLSGIVYEAYTGLSSTEHALQNHISIDPAFLQVSNNRIKVHGECGSSAQLQLYTYGLKVSIDITLTQCQPGYIYDSHSHTCECADSQYWGLEGCYPKVHIRDGYWMGFCLQNSPDLCTGVCPYGFCSYSHTNPSGRLHLLTNDPNILESEICGPQRRGRLCGECSHGYSYYYNSWNNQCGPDDLCYLGWLFYIFSDIVPLTSLFIVVLVWNISFTSGISNCFVLYGQVVGFITFKAIGSMRGFRLIQEIVLLVYNSFNLKFFVVDNLAYCIWTGASLMNVLMVHYFTVLFALALVLTTIFVTRYKYIRTKIFFKFKYRHSFLFHGLSAFFILCYSQATITSFKILNYSCLYSVDFKCAVKVVHHAGHLDYMKGEHVAYVIVAFIFLLFMIIIPPLLLVLYPLIFKLLGLCNLSETKIIRILWKILPIQFLDAFQSSFKDKYRFFAGLYFFYRALILGLYVCAQSWLQFFGVVQLLLTVILTTHAVLQPHKERKHNIIDSLLFANLCLINAITLFCHGHIEFRGQFRSEELIITLMVVQATLIILPLFIIIALRVVKWKQSRKRENLADLPSLRVCREPLIEKKP